jgi:electron transfer flavoprotein alpha subunit
MTNETNKGAVWVVAELKGVSVQAVSLQLVGKARTLADELGVGVEAILLGDQLDDGASKLIAAGADTVYIAESAELAMYQAELWATLICELSTRKKPEIILLGSTFIGRELAPILAARLNTGLTAHCMGLVLQKDGVLDQQIPAYGGLISILCPEKRPQMATVAGGVFPTPEPDNTRSGAVVTLAIPENIDIRAKTLEIVEEQSDERSLDSAPFIVAGGAGAENDAGWNKIRELSEVLNAALGCTRPAVDEGWADLETMIGQSGKMVSPQFYMGVGLSGELQHMVGIKGAQIMVAINNDPKSPVFEQVDYGIVEECGTFIPLLIEKIKDYRGNA